MKLYKAFLLLFIFAFASSCVEENKNAETEASVDEETKASVNKESEEDSSSSFKEVYKNLQKALEKEDALLLNGMVHPEYGTFVIEAGGAVPYFVLARDFGGYRSFATGESFFDIAPDSLPLYKEEKLPKVDCDNPPEFYSKSGVYMNTENKLLPTEIWKHAGLQEKMMNKAEEMVNTITLTVENTSGFTYYFSEIKGDWYLMFIDMRSPCQA